MERLWLNKIIDWRRFIYFAVMLYIETRHVVLHLLCAYLKKKKKGGPAGPLPFLFPSGIKIQLPKLGFNPTRQSHLSLGTAFLGKMIWSTGLTFQHCDKFSAGVMKNFDPSWMYTGGNYWDQKCWIKTLLYRRRSRSDLHVRILNIVNLIQPYNRCVL